MRVTRWSVGETVVRRELLHDHVWIGFSTYVVEDTDDLLAVYLAEGSTLAFPEWPFEQWQHPWRTAGHHAWRGHGKLMLHRPGDAYSVDLFWTGADRQFSGWYINLQDPIRRQERGFDTLDHELDYWLSASGSWSVKDDELFDQRVAEGRYSEQQATSIRATGSQVVDMLRTGSHWWDESWANWSPPSRWRALDLPDGWQTPTVNTLES